MERSIIFDTETTDLIRNSLIADKHLPHIIEFAAVAVEGAEIVDRLDFLCNPGFPISEEVTKITGINDEMVDGMPPFSERFEEVQSFFAAGEEAVAHNLAFDKAVVEVAARRLDREMIWPRLLTCTVEGTEHLKGHRLSLSALHEYLFGEPFSGAHRAMVDVEALFRCCVELRERDEI